MKKASISFIFSSCSFLLVANAQFDSLEEACRNVNVSEFDISQFFKHNASLNEWDRPVLNAREPIVVDVQLGMSSFASVVRNIQSFFFTQSNTYFLPCFKHAE